MIDRACIQAITIRLQVRLGISHSQRLPGSNERIVFSLTIHSIPVDYIAIFFRYGGHENNLVTLHVAASGDIASRNPNGILILVVRVCLIGKLTGAFDAIANMGRARLIIHLDDVFFRIRANRQRAGGRFNFFKVIALFRLVFVGDRVLVWRAIFHTLFNVFHVIVEVIYRIVVWILRVVEVKDVFALANRERRFLIRHQRVACDLGVRVHSIAERRSIRYGVSNLFRCSVQIIVYRVSGSVLFIVERQRIRLFFKRDCLRLGMTVHRIEGI